MMAAFNGRTDALNALLEAGADVAPRARQTWREGRLTPAEPARPPPSLARLVGTARFFSGLQRARRPRAAPRAWSSWVMSIVPHAGVRVRERVAASVSESVSHEGVMAVATAMGWAFGL